ncbi:hypothetical protein AKO1_003581 [Acrasis kona]|uniref:Uncharacterized protein n=1 Tax=Acrasis kona TaxID=1008807 RepID=A0AAW2YHU9_9EUKA
MVTANTEVKFEAAWIDFKVEFPSVVPYFEKQWILPKYSELDPFYYHWCRINRRTSYGLWWVNNFIENKIRMWTALKVHANNYRVDKALQFVIDILDDAVSVLKVSGNSVTCAVKTNKEAQKSLRFAGL